MENISCTYQWKIVNLSESWWLRQGDRIDSPAFIADGVEGTKWRLWLYLMGDKNEKGIVYLHRELGGPNRVEVKYDLVLLCEDGSILKEVSEFETFRQEDPWGSIMLDTENVIITYRHLPEDTLTVQCVLGDAKKTVPFTKSKHIYARTLFKMNRKSFDWRIGEFSNILPGVIKELKGHLMKFALVLNEDPDKKTLSIKITSLNNCVRYISCNTSIIDSEGKKQSCGVNRFYLDAQFRKEVLSDKLNFLPDFLEYKDRYLPNDILFLNFDLALSSVVHSGGVPPKDVEHGKYATTAAKVEDFKSMYTKRIFSDMEIRTPTKTFPAHKCVLSARSSVFYTMLTTEMTEGRSGQVVIEDMDDDTVQQMLHFMYTGLLKDLQFESASKLFQSADKYEIICLKSICSSFLKENLCPTTACDVLVLADRHQDSDLKDAVQDYILDHFEIFGSSEWEHFMNTDIKLAANIMYRQMNPDTI